MTPAHAFGLCNPPPGLSQPLKFCILGHHVELLKGMENQTRRKFLKSSGMATLGFMGLHELITSSLQAQPLISDHVGYGPLQEDPNGILRLPKGFAYKIISQRGDTMTDGFLVPGRADGMGAFKAPQGKTLVIRNHELNPDQIKESPFGKTNQLLSKFDASKFYDAGKGKLPGLGGTTTFIYDHVSNKIEKQFLSLAGTSRNCAGGPTPWNTWITCEETTVKVGAFEGTGEKDHGYVFEVPASDKMETYIPVPIKAMGRFNHEAVAVDPQTSIVYLTEDVGDSLFYRYVPKTPRKLLDGGKLQTLVIRGLKNCDTRNWKDTKSPVFPKQQFYAVEWIDITNVESPENDLRYQGFEKGAARFARGEGIWFGNHELYFACTNGGPDYNGQVFRYRPSASEGKPAEKTDPGKLELFLEADKINLLRNCDNLTVAPWGDLILCEDNNAPYLVGVTPKGECYHLAENIGHASEFAGGVFSPAGNTYFVNIQGPGLTLAIQGPWKK
jgi:secreted PhoX family phosphatase